MKSFVLLIFGEN